MKMLFFIVFIKSFYQKTIGECVMNKPRVNTSELILGYIQETENFLLNSKNAMTLIQMEENQSSSQQKVVFQLVSKEVKQSYIGIIFEIIDFKHYKIKKYIQSEDLEDIQKILNLKKETKVIVCPSLFSSLEQNFTNHMFQVCTKKYTKHHQPHQYKYRAYKYNAEEIKNKLNKRKSTKHQPSEITEKYFSKYNTSGNKKAKSQRRLITKNNSYRNYYQIIN